MKARLRVTAHIPVIMVTLFLVTACERNLDVVTPMTRQHELFVTYNPNRESLPHGLATVTLKPGDAAWEQLVEWFVNNYQYWHGSDEDTIDQHQAISIRGDGVFFIEIHDTLMRVGFNNENGHYRQYWRSCKLEEFQFLLDLDDRDWGSGE